MSNNYTSTADGTINLKQFTKTVISRLISAIVILGLMFFLPAGTFNYWEAWVLIAIFVIPATCVMIYYLKHDPELLERRIKMREKEKEQKNVMKFSIIFLFLVFLIPGLDQRYGWSSVPLELIILGDCMVFLGYILFIFVLRENRYASRIIEVAQDQTVISTGPYAVVRHPLYLAVLFIYGFSPLALDSYWALPFTLILIILTLIFRIRNEEKVLAKELKGYQEYTQKTKYRLIPGIW